MKYNHALVIGGGFAGMLAAYMLSQHYQQVTIIEREDIAHQPRKRLPQQPHLHVLMQRGQVLLNQLMPGILQEMHAAGLPEVDWAQDTRWYGPFGAYPQYHSDVKTLTFSREILDKFMLARVQGQTNIKIICGTCDHIAIKNNTAQSVHVRMINDRENIISADLVVEARGRNADSRQTLINAGYHLPEARIITTDIGYASCVYRRTAENTSDFKQLYLQIRHGIRSRGVVVSAVDAERMVITALGIGKDKPSRNRNEYLAFLASLHAADLQTFLARLQPDSDITLYRNLQNRHQQFGKCKHWPKRLIAIGDAVCLLNPVYGQGMTLAVRQVHCLQQTLLRIKSKPNGKWEQAFQKKVDRINFVAWTMATTEDQRALPREDLSIMMRMMHRYLDSLFNLAVKHENIHAVCVKVLHMIKHPIALFKPAIMLRVLLNMFTNERAA